jgi:hypothetical protein
MNAPKGIAALLVVLIKSQASLAAENLALRQQLAVLTRSMKRPKLRQRDRRFWAWFSGFWPGWKTVLAIVRPETVSRWHRQGFRLYWRWKSKTKNGRPKLDVEIRQLIRRMSRENPTWGAPRIRSELRLLGHDLGPVSWDGLFGTDNPSYRGSSSGSRICSFLSSQPSCRATLAGYCQRAGWRS